MNLTNGKVFTINLLGPGPRPVKKNLPARGLTKVEKHCVRACSDLCRDCFTFTFY